MRDVDGLPPKEAAEGEERVRVVELGDDEPMESSISFGKDDEVLGGGAKREDLVPVKFVPDGAGKPLGIPEPDEKELGREDILLASQSGTLGEVLGLGGITFLFPTEEILGGRFTFGNAVEELGNP